MEATGLFHTEKKCEFARETLHYIREHRQKNGDSNVYSRFSFLKLIVHRILSFHNFTLEKNEEGSDIRFGTDENELADVFNDNRNAYYYRFVPRIDDFRYFVCFDVLWDGKTEIEAVAFTRLPLRKGDKKIVEAPMIKFKNFPVLDSKNEFNDEERIGNMLVKFTSKCSDMWFFNEDSY